MSSRVQFLASGVIVLAALLVLIETLYFASRRPDYSHVSNTISELGESGAPDATWVSFGFFLPVGLLVWLALLLVCRGTSDRYALLALIFLASLGAGYVASAFFPCDPGAPLFGTWRTQIHNVAGFVDYEGTGIGFLLVSRYFARRHATFQAVAFLFAAVLLFVCLAMLSSESAHPARGAIQRVAEPIQFAGVFFVCYLLSAKGESGSVDQSSGGRGANRRKSSCGNFPVAGKFSR